MSTPDERPVRQSASWTAPQWEPPWDGGHRPARRLGPAGLARGPEQPTPWDMSWATDDEPAERTDDEPEAAAALRDRRRRTGPTRSRTRSATPAHVAARARGRPGSRRLPDRPRHVRRRGHEGPARTARLRSRDEALDRPPWERADAEHRQHDSTDSTDSTETQPTPQPGTAARQRRTRRSVVAIPRSPPPWSPSAAGTARRPGPRAAVPCRSTAGASSPTTCGSGAASAPSSGACAAGSGGGTTARARRCSASGTSPPGCARRCPTVTGSQS
jgi:hypothetical protein